MLQIDEIDRLARWRYHGRLVARQLDDAHVVIRSCNAGPAERGNARNRPPDKGGLG